MKPPYRQFFFLLHVSTPAAAPARHSPHRLRGTHGWEFGNPEPTGRCAEAHCRRMLTGRWPVSGSGTRPDSPPSSRAPMAGAILRCCAGPTSAGPPVITGASVGPRHCRPGNPSPKTQARKIIGTFWFVAVLRHRPWMMAPGGLSARCEPQRAKGGWRGRTCAQASVPPIPTRPRRPRRFLLRSLPHQSPVMSARASGCPGSPRPPAPAFAATAIARRH